MQQKCSQPLDGAVYLLSISRRALGRLIAAAVISVFWQNQNEKNKPIKTIEHSVGVKE